MSVQKLTKDDVMRLFSDPSADTRAVTAGKVAEAFSDGSLSDNERSIAEDIFRALVKDAAVKVRETLANSVKATPDLPHDIALKLAEDVASVAIPVIETSDVLTDEDLIAIIASSHPEKQVAVAHRPTVSDHVAEALVDTENVDAVAELMANEGADMSESTLIHAAHRFGADERVAAPLVQRQKLPVAVSEKLVHLVSERLQQHLAARHELSPAMATDLILQARERATLGLLSGKQPGRHRSRRPSGPERAPDRQPDPARHLHGRHRLPGGGVGPPDRHSHHQRPPAGA